jgi:hypothetical protein
MATQSRTANTVGTMVPGRQPAPPVNPIEAPSDFPDTDAERRFWDTQDTGRLAGFHAVEDEGSPTEGLSHVLSVRLDRQSFRALAAAARRVGVGPSTLLRMWALERLRAESPPHSSKS